MDKTNAIVRSSPQIISELEMLEIHGGLSPDGISIKSFWNCECGRNTTCPTNMYCSEAKCANCGKCSDQCYIDPNDSTWCNGGGVD